MKVPGQTMNKSQQKENERNRERGGGGGGEEVHLDIDGEGSQLQSSWELGLQMEECDCREIGESPLVISETFFCP